MEETQVELWNDMENMEETRGYQWKQGVVAILRSRLLIFTKRKRKIISFDVLVL